MVPSTNLGHSGEGRLYKAKTQVKHTVDAFLCPFEKMCVCVSTK